MITKQKKEQIKINIRNLDFNLIEKTLKNLNIKWKDSKTGEKRFPNKKELVYVAEKCMIKAFQNKETKMASIGGFQAEVVNNIVEIRFVLTQSNPLSVLLS